MLTLLSASRRWFNGKQEECSMSREYQKGNVADMVSATHECRWGRCRARSLSVADRGGRVSDPALQYAESASSSRIFLSCNMHITESMTSLPRLRRPAPRAGWLSANLSSPERATWYHCRRCR